MRCLRRVVLLAAVLLSAGPSVAVAQTLQIVPFGGYRFGGDLYEWFTGTALDAEAAPCAGVIVDVSVRERTSVSFLYSRQWTNVAVVDPVRSTLQRQELFVEHWHVGGTQDLEDGPIRPFLAGSAGLTRVGGAHDSDVRFSLGGSAGVKLMPSEHLGLRLEGRVYAVWVEGGVHRGTCGGYGCAFAVDALFLWQGELTAGLVVGF